VALVSGELSLEEGLALLDRLRGRAGELDREQLGLAARQRELDRQLAKLTKELERWRGAPRREAYTAVIDLEAGGAGALEVELSYVVDAASWQPLYDLRFSEEAGEAWLEVGYLAQVAQRSGEAWDQVALALSTARPALAGTLPELEPWYVRPLPPPRPLPARPVIQAERSQDRMMLKASISPALPAAAEAAFEEAEPALASVDSSGAAVTYQAPGTAAIPADGTPHKVSIARYRLGPQLDYVTAPRRVEAAYRRAKVANDSPYTLLPGPANLFAGDEFIGATRLELIAPQGEIELYLGVDDRLKVARELKRREVDKKFIGGKRRIHYGYEITLENLLPRRVEVTLHDQLPVSGHEEVKVRLESASPAPSEHSELNLLDWKLDLAPKEKKTVRFDFSIESPQGMELLGVP
jgi:uncharacterized protein (TIGR02231 family)